ncbi:hypothetical protein ACWEPC_22060 [Nonomuraea sp. NPDC004297]
MRNQLRSVLAGTAVVVGLIAPANTASAAAASCTWLGDLPGNDSFASIAGASASGEYAVGASEKNGRFLWRNGQTVASWPVEQGGKRDTPDDVNSSGVVIGTRTPWGGPSEAYVWRTPGSGNPTILRVSNAEWVEPIAINDTGDVLGYITRNSVGYAVIWPASNYATNRVVGPGRPVDISNDGRILLHSKKMLYPDGTLHDLQTPAGVTAFSITESPNSGRPVGYGTTTAGTEISIVWNTDGTVAHTVEGARPVAANTAGDTVGLVKRSGAAGYDSGFWQGSGTPLLFSQPDPLGGPGDMYLGDNGVLHSIWVSEDYSDSSWSRWRCS